MFREAKKDAVILKHNIDSAFISHLEQKDQTIQFKRIDADLTEELRGEEAADEETSKTLTEVFRGALKNDKLEVKVENLKNEKVAAMMTLSEESRLYAGYDEDVQYVRHGSIYVWRSGNSGSECETSAGSVCSR